jgi:hypothetical protein
MVVSFISEGKWRTRNKTTALSQVANKLSSHKVWSSPQHFILCNICSVGWWPVLYNKESESEYESKQKFSWKSELHVIISSLPG